MKKMIKENEAIKFLLDSGLLFEINRVVLHPLGMALGVRIEEDGTCKFDGLWDCRDEEEGIIFSDEVLREGTKKYNQYMVDEGISLKNKRYDKLGYICQEKYDDLIIKSGKELKDQFFVKSKCQTENCGENHGKK